MTEQTTPLSVVIEKATTAQTVNIPEQLHNWRFILLFGSSKIPTKEMKGWCEDRENKTFKHDSEKLASHILENNYGVVTDKDRFVLAADTKEIEETIEKSLPKTFTVQSPRHKTKHFYYYGAIHSFITFKPTSQGDPCADLKYGNAYVLGPGSRFIDKTTDYGEYTVIDDVPITSLSEDQLTAALDPFITRQTPDEESNITEETGEQTQSNIAIKDLLPNLAEFDQNGDELTGPHPVHGSTTGSNFHVNTTRNEWFCFREGHRSGGGVLSLIGVLEGKIQCQDCHKGAIRGEIFKEIKNLAVGKYGYQDVNQKKEWFYLDDYGHKHFQPIIFAKYLLQNYRFKTTGDNKTIFVYEANKGIYTPIGPKIIQSEMGRLLGDDMRKRYYPDVEFYIQAVTFFDRPKTMPNKIAVTNGLLNVGTGELQPFTPNEWITSQIPIEYTPTVECPQITKFLTEVVGPDQLCVIEEQIGYCLLQDYPYHKATMFVGDGSNGKSTLIELIKRFLGAENVSNVTLQSLCENRFAPTALDRKLANLCADIPDKALTRTGMFKMLTGNDTIQGEPKYCDLYFFKNYAKLIFSANKVPETTDDTSAFFRRWNIITCPNIFTGTNCNPRILEKIATQDELSGLLNLALKGLHDLIDRGEFCNNPTFEELREKYIKASNPAQAFIEECLVYDSQATTPKDDLYQKYVEYCKQNKLPTNPKNIFSQKLAQFMPQVRTIHPNINKKAVWCWQGAKVKTTSTGSTGSLSDAENVKSEKWSTDRQPVEPVEASEEIVCGQCQKWHTGTCTFPGDPNCVTPINKAAVNCKDFTPQPREVDIS